MIVAFNYEHLEPFPPPYLLDVAGQIPVVLGACSRHVLTEETGDGFCGNGLHLARRDRSLGLRAGGLGELLLLFVLVLVQQRETRVAGI